MPILYTNENVWYLPSPHKTFRITHYNLHAGDPIEGGSLGSSRNIFLPDDNLVQLSSF